MLKREQILLTGWLSEWFHYCAKKYDLSYSELIRITLCLQIAEWIKESYPNYKFNFSKQKLTKEFQKLLKGSHSQVKLHKYFSDLYFEARKAVEFLVSKENK